MHTSREEVRYSLPLFVVFPLKSHGKLIMLGKTKVWSASALSLGLVALLSGCAGVQTTPGRYHIASDALKKPVDYTRVCVLENPAVKADVLIEAIQDGINAAEATYVPLPAGAGPATWSYTISYDVLYDGRVLRSVSFFTFENGVPIYSARGTPNGSGGVTFDMVSQYVQLVIERSKQGRSRVLPQDETQKGNTP